MGASHRKSKDSRYFFCDWNILKEHSLTPRWDDDDPTSTSHTIRKCLALVAPSWKEEKDDESNAHLIVVVPRDSDEALSIDDLRFYATGLGKNPKKVLYVHSGAPISFVQGRVNEWLFIASDAACPTETLGVWLRTGLSFDAFPARQAFDLEFAGKELQYVLSRTQEYLIRWHRATVSQSKHDSIRRKSFESRIREKCRLDTLELSRTGRMLVKEALTPRKKSHAKFFYALCRLCKDYNRVEHDIRARESRSEEGSAVDTIMDQMRLQFLDICVDLRKAIAARSRCNATDHSPGKHVILIDDNPNRAMFSTRAMIAVRKFLPGYTLTIWNPDEPLTANGLKRSDIEQYTSLNIGKLATILSKRVRSFGTAKNGDAATLEKLLENTHVILVDILFADARGKDYEAGYGIMRGLQRLCRDAQNYFAKKRGLNDGDWSIPEIIALSRANDIDKVQTVYRSGAGAYLLKNRPLSLPGAVADTFQPALDPVNTPHRTFRQLYNLPHKTIGVLRTTALPPIPFHASVHSDGNANDEREETLRYAQTLAKLLAALPKADLHIHPGTCMTPEFLVAASLIMLTRTAFKNQEALNDFCTAIKWLDRMFNGSKLTLSRELIVRPPGGTRDVDFCGKPETMRETATGIRSLIAREIRAGNRNRCQINPQPDMEERYLQLRSVLHSRLRIPDHETAREILLRLDKLSDYEWFFFALRHADSEDPGANFIQDKDDLLRLYLLWLAADAECYGSSHLSIGDIEIDIDTWFRKAKIHHSDWVGIHNMLYGEEGFEQVRFIEDRNWRLPVDWVQSRRMTVHLAISRTPGWGGLIEDCPTAEEHPIAFLLATGTRSHNLREYLGGCEYTGAEHMRHPYLMHLFAQQTVYEFVRHGVLYAELRAALSGYENSDLAISFNDASACFCRAMGQAQEMVLHAYRGQKTEGWLWNKTFDVNSLFDPLEDELASYRFPCKTSVILTGKRHKASRLLLREAGAGAVLHARPANPAHTARDFADEAMEKCRVVGFDLAGQEDEHHPKNFRMEYEQISRLHIPVTIHAGENAPSNFVESAILDLRAKRLGHGLALAEDRPLMARARDEDICIELCPVSNFQTNAVYQSGSKGDPRRTYPMRIFLEAGLNVTINTDNPVVSCTNMIKECFQAAYAMGEGREALSLWDLLRILRAGFTQSFLTQPERGALLELADQIVFDLFSQPKVIEMLRVTGALRKNL